VSDEKDQTLELTSEQWVELLQQWFDENEVEVVIGEKAVDFIKFTAFVSVLELPEQSPEGEGDTSEEAESPEETSEDMGAEEGTEPKAEPESEPESEETKEAEESPKETEEPEDDKELKEFEDALGL
jgi:hypothetical protein